MTQCDSLIVTISFLLHLNEISKITSTFKVYIAFRGLCVSEFHKGRTNKNTQSRAMFKYSKRDLFSFFYSYEKLHCKNVYTSEVDLKEKPPRRDIYNTVT